MPNTKRSTGSIGVAGDVYPDREALHPADPDGNPAGLSVGDTRDTEADPTPNTMEAAAKNQDQKAVQDEFAVVDPPGGDRPAGAGRQPNPRNVAARDFARSHPNQWVRVGKYDKKGAIPDILRQIDGMRVLTQWSPVKDGEGFYLFLKLTSEPYVKQNRGPRKKAAPSVDPNATTDGMEHSDAVKAEEEVKANG